MSCSSSRSPIRPSLTTRGAKEALYASYGVRELWVTDAVKLGASVFCEPSADGYGKADNLLASERIVPLLAPEAFPLRLNELEME